MKDAEDFVMTPARQRFVEYLGSDSPREWLWHGHPGLVIDEHRGRDGTLFGTSVAFVGGPSLELDGENRVADITEVEYRLRGERLLARLHPVRIGPAATDPMTAEGWEWPDGPPS